MGGISGGFLVRLVILREKFELMEFFDLIDKTDLPDL